MNFEFTCCGVHYQQYVYTNYALITCCYCGRTHKYTKATNTVMLLQLDINYSQYVLLKYGTLDVRAITTQNYIKVYVDWCRKNQFAPIGREILDEIFLGCETNSDFGETLNVLFLIQDKGFKLSFMKDKESKDALIMRLKIRLELFKRIPSATNMLLAYNLIEELTLKIFAAGDKDISDEMNRSIERFDKCKNLALDTKYINERKLAFERSVELFKKLTQIEL